MQQEFDISTDYGFWDFTEEVTYTSVRPNTINVQETAVQCLRRAVTRKEAAMSRGAYRHDDTTFNVPKDQLVVEPKQRDTITDESSKVWTVIDVSYNAWRQTWRLVCRNMVIVEDLKDTLTIEKPEFAQDLSGARFVNWATLYSDISCRLQPVSSQIAEERGLRGLKVTHTCYLAQELTVSNEYRATVNSTYYEIRGYKQSERIDQLPYLELELVP